MGFDPDAYLAKKQEDFDPDAYLKSKQIDDNDGNRGLISSIINSVDKYTGAPVRKGISEGLKAGSPIEALKAYGNQFGEPTELAPSQSELAAQMGASDKRQILTAAEQQKFDELNQPGWAASMKQMGKEYQDRELPSNADILGVPLGMITDPMSYIPFGAAARGVESVGVNIGKRILSPLTGTLGKFAVEAAPDAAKIAEATENIGGSATKGMLSKDQFISDIESGLSQTPTQAGQEIAKQQQAIRKGLMDTGEKALSQKTELTPVQVGSNAKEIISKGIEQRLEPAINVYKRLESETPFIDLNPQSTERVAKNIESLDVAQIKGTPEASFVKNMADNLREYKSLDQLRKLKTYVGEISRDISKSPSYRKAAIEIGDKLQKMEQSSVIRASISAAKDAKYGQSVASEMIKEIKDANKVYASASQDLKDLAKNSGMGKVRNYSDFIRKMEAIPDEQLTQKMFTTKNVKGLDSLKVQFPEAYESMRQAKLGDIYKSSITKGEISPAKLINQVKKMPPELRARVFGPESDQQLKDIETVYNSIKSPVGPSGTPKGEEFVGYSILKPTTWWNEIHANATKWLLDNPNAKIVRGAESLNKAPYRSISFKPKSGADFLAYPGAKGLLNGTGLLNNEQDQ